ncbi:MAG: type II toxin-antitoxin system RelE/ParE family toxin [Trichlorobacter sp.]|uniref:type II toxin-antitoxin system RelE/ParE family toxin n=1 Tax=Trichlorobacter sp. TaxID=2911007 RepID=UPI00255ED870|nr:type II toxin-antitoxin system RelE/ParE family toxin [Trichlorobacter sp.]MDK9718749.1 type II toxin-antitoxin system RelE/ParE family toxin [Trichlorobacter sp.]
MNIRFIEVAQQELDEAFDWYELQTVGLGRQLIAEVQVATRRIAMFPEGCHEVAPEIRRCLIRRFPYALIYRKALDELIILAVMHQHRKPRYWQTRLELA